MNNSTTSTGILHKELRLGVVTSVSASDIRINLRSAGSPTATHFLGDRYGKGEVGEFVIIEGQTKFIFGRIISVRLPEKERHEIPQDFSGNEHLDTIGIVQILGSISVDTLRVTAGVEEYPRLGDRVYSAPHTFLARLPSLVDNDDVSKPIQLDLGTIASGSNVLSITPEKLFGRHCAILGATGGGKSWTVARLIEECLKYQGAKLVLIDATGEYRGFRCENDNHIIHCHLGTPLFPTDDSISCLLPPTSFEESDFIALFEPSGKVQSPKFREAIRSLRLAQIEPILANNGMVIKANTSKNLFLDAEKKNAELLDDPRTPFDVKKLSGQIYNECVQPGTLSQWGKTDEFNYSNCISLIVRIDSILSSNAFKCVFCKDESKKPITETIACFMNSNVRMLRICMSGIPFDYKVREIVANAIGRHLLKHARSGCYQENPLFLVLDEAHHFLGRHIGTEDTIARLDAFEQIAREGRKFGLNICFATQRPRDITEGVLSQIGTLIVHRLTNEKDREIVEKACGEIDRSASAFLPNLKPGEATIIGVDFPIPLTIQVRRPTNEPKSDGPKYQSAWKESCETADVF
jgi:DNA helicase HerA-like ATPase